MRLPEHVIANLQKMSTTLLEIGGGCGDLIAMYGALQRAMREFADANLSDPAQRRHVQQLARDWLTKSDEQSERLVSLQMLHEHSVADFENTLRTLQEAE